MSSFRSLAPSSQQESSSTSSPVKLPSESTSGGTGDTSADVSGSARKDSGGGSGSGGYGGRNRKRRTAGSVSLMACTPCRQARQRCDGQRPQVCGRCAHRKLDCVYEPHTKTHKDDLIREIEHLRGDNTSLHNINREIKEEAAQADTRNQNLQEEGIWQRIILETIGSNGHDKEIIKRLGAGESHHAIADWLVRENPDFGNLGPQPNTHRELVDVVQFFESQCQDQDGLYRFSSSESEIPWTKVTTSETLLGHLFDLYFTWVHPVHMLFSELEFKTDFKDSRENYCSASLVNAICAMACHLLANEHIRNQRDRRDRRNEMDATTLRDRFMSEARKYLLPESYYRLTSIQTFAVMYLVELSSGKARKAMGYLRSAMENITVDEGSQYSEEAKELSIWGIHTLNTYGHFPLLSNVELVTADEHRASAGIVYQKLYAPPRSGEPTFQNVCMDKDDAVWRFYRNSGDERELPTRPSHAIVTACHQARLFWIINETLNLYCGTRGQISAYKVLSVYRKYLDWKESLPPIIANISEGDQPLPHMLFLHVQYHTALTQLFRPLLHGNLFSDDDKAELCRILVFHARSGIEPLSHAKRLYSARFCLPLMNFCLVNLCDALVSYSTTEPSASDTAAFCLESLQETRAGFPLCGPLQSLFYRRTEECGVQIPDKLEDLVNSFNHYAVDDFLDACTRLTYREPLDQIIRLIDPSIAKEWHAEWETQIINRKRSRGLSSGGRYLQIDNILNGGDK